MQFYFTVCLRDIKGKLTLLDKNLHPSELTTPNGFGLAGKLLERTTHNGNQILHNSLSWKLAISQDVSSLELVFQHSNAKGLYKILLFL